jgi:Carboxypeptidase regulatory-like domain/TonB-dependent Receptor Plug Domain
MRYGGRFIAALATLSLLSGTAYAQVQTGSIFIKATDEQGAVLPGATITIASPVIISGQMVGVTDEAGAYRFPSLLPGTYSVRLELSGFQATVRDGIVVSVGQTVTLDLGLKVGGLTESVTVTGASPVVDTKSANVGVNLDSKLLETTPGGRDIWSVVEYKVPGLVMAAPDVGGNQGGLQRGITARGTGNGQNTQMLNGVNVGDPAAIGFAGYYYDPSSFEDIQVSSGAQDITVPSGGVFINMVTKSGTNRFGSQTLFTYQAEGTQSDNIDEELKNFGLRPNAAAVDKITNFNVNAGGPLLRNRAFYFAALNDQRTHVNVVGFPAVGNFGGDDIIEKTDITSIFARPTLQMGTNHRFDATLSRQVYDKPNRGASNTNTPESTWHEHDILAVYQGLWNWVLSSRSFIDTRVSYNSIDFPLQLKTTQQTLADITFNPNIRTRANTTHQVMIRERVQASANYQYFIPELVGGRHEIRAGIDNAYTPENVTLLRNGDVQLTYRSQPSGTTPAGAAQVIVSNTPLEQKRALMNTALYLQDSYSRGPITLVGGLRWERVEGWLPAQSSPPSQFFPEGMQIPVTILGQPTTYTIHRTFEEVRQAPLWHHLGPRFSAIYDVRGDGRTALKLSVAKYYDQIGTGTPGGINPNGNVTQTYTWNDINNDLVFQAGEQSGTPTTSVPGFATLQQLGRTSLEIERPYRNELTVGIDHELAPGLRVSAAWIQRKEHDPLTNIEIGIPFDYYDPVQRVDPGRDGLTGTGDDGVITVYNMKLPTIPSATITGNDDRVAQRYKGLELTAIKRSSNRWQMIAGYTWSRTEFETDSVTTPNAFVNNEGRAGIDRAHNFKFTGSYEIRWGILTSGNLRWLSGEPITRTIGIPGLNQNPNGNVNVNAEPRGSDILPSLLTIDFRISKLFRYHSQTFETGMDLYNLTNENTVYDVRRNTGRTTARYAADPTGAQVTFPMYGSPINVLGPRIVRFNVSYKF